MPATQRLGIFRTVGIIGRHILAHDRGSIFCDVEAGLETVLQLHPGNRLSIDTGPIAILAVYQALGGAFEIFVGHRQIPQTGEVDIE